MKQLRHEVSVYAAINRYYGHRFPRLRAVPHGVRGWLDGMAFLNRPTGNCGCARLGGGGRHYCSNEHFLAHFEESP